jgi:hypothetical protein
MNLHILNKLLAENFDGVNSAYIMFKYPVRGDLTRKYYERRIRLFFDYKLFLSGLFLSIITRIIKAGFYPVMLFATIILVLLP